jgi:hypothetical protein
VLKKAGIVAAAATAALLAVSPLAFAGDKGHDGHDGHDGHKRHSHGKNVNEADNSSGFVNVSGNNINVPIQACDNQVPVNVLGIQVPLNGLGGIADVTGALGLLGDENKAVRKGDNTLDDSCSQEGTSGDTVKQKIDD